MCNTTGESGGDGWRVGSRAPYFGAATPPFCCRPRYITATKIHFLICIRTCLVVCFFYNLLIAARSLADLPLDCLLWGSTYS